MNARNAGPILEHNPRALFPLVDDKLQLAEVCFRIGVPTPYAILRRSGGVTWQAIGAVFRDDPTGRANIGHMRDAFFMSYDAANCEYLKLASPEVDERLANGPDLVSANFVIPYPPGFPIMVPGQIITPQTIAFMRKLDVKEIHGYHAEQGLKLLTPQALAAHGARTGR